MEDQSEQTKLLREIRDLLEKRSDQAEEALQAQREAMRIQKRMKALLLPIIVVLFLAIGVLLFPLLKLLGV